MEGPNIPTTELTALLLLGAALLFIGPFYAETHFKVPPWKGPLYRREPEIYWDCPWRFTRGETLPLALIVKDGSRFPAVLQEPVVTALCKGESFRLRFCSPTRFPAKIEEPFFYTTLELRFPDKIAGPVQISPQIRIRVGGEERFVGVSSHPAFSDAPLEVYAAETGLPSLPGWTYVEPHTHTWHTSDQVEFGAPTEMISRFAKTIGIDWVVLTDHSFDLLTPEGRWIGHDPEQGRWKKLGAEVKALNAAAKGARLIRGEEVSCGSAAGANLHLLVYDSPELIPGSGDAGKDLLFWRNKPDISLQTALKTARRNGAVVFAAHPIHRLSFAERKALNRSDWGEEDLAQDLDGIEVWNRNIPERLEESRRRWIELLLRGYRKPASAGSDAHGDFNRSRRVRMPLFSVKENFTEGFGRPRTAVRASEETQEEILTALKAGRSVMTNGPLIVLEAAAESGERAEMGGSLRGRNVSAHVQAVSTEEFGSIRRVELRTGTIGAEREASLTLAKEIGGEGEFRAQLVVEKPSYIRAECETERGFAMTNPIWIDPA